MTSTYFSRLFVQRIPTRCTPAVFAFYMSGIMAMLMSLVIVAAGSGIGNGYLLRVLHAYQLAMPVAFVCVMMVRPLVVKLVALTVKPASVLR